MNFGKNKRVSRLREQKTIKLNETFGNSFFLSSNFLCIEWIFPLTFSVVLYWSEDNATTQTKKQ